VPVGGDQTRQRTVTGKTARRAIRFEKTVSPDYPMLADDLRSADMILARLVAAAFAADHLEVLHRKYAVESIMGNDKKTPTMHVTDQ